MDPLWFAVEQLRRIVESLGWKMTVSDTQGDTVKVSFEKSKEEILKP